MRLGCKIQTISKWSLRRCRPNGASHRLDSVRWEAAIGRLASPGEILPRPCFVCSRPRNANRTIQRRAVITSSRLGTGDGDVDSPARDSRTALCLHSNAMVFGHEWRCYPKGTSPSGALRTQSRCLWHDSPYRPAATARDGPAIQARRALAAGSPRQPSLA